MKPEIRDHAEAAHGFRHWADGMSRLADLGAHCKFSGLVTEARADWTDADLKPYADHVLRAFGAERIMWGSDWPVCQLRASYDQWRAAAETLTLHLDAEARAEIFGGTATRFYRLAI